MQAFDQRYLLNRIEWDNLIVLDACRYDIFRRVWSREEKVIGVISPASWTLEWLDRVFGNVFIEAEVFSATPYINSLTEINMYGVRWNAREHFRKIIDLWLTAWDPRLGIVPPQKVYLAVIVRNIGAKYAKKSTIRKRIIWFLQPHYPYLSEYFSRWMREYVRELTYTDFLTGKMENTLIKILRNIVMKNSGEIVNAYEETLERTLKYVYKLIDRLDGVTIVTSDHGELFGECVLTQIISTIANLVMQSIKEHTFIYIARRSKILAHLFKYTFYNAKTDSKNSIGSAYIIGSRVFFHPSILYSTILRKVPFVVIK